MNGNILTNPPMPLLPRPTRLLPSARAALLALILPIALFSCTSGPPEKPRVLLVGIDAGSLPRVQELARQGRLPNFSRLMSQGASGHLASIYAELPFSPRRGGGYWSPLVWTSIATGKEPAVHGIIDFRLPDPETYRICTLPEVQSAEIRLQPPAGATMMRLSRPADDGDSGWMAHLEVPPAGPPIALPAGSSVDFGLPPGASMVQLHIQAPHPVAPLCLRPIEFLDADGNLAGSMDLVAHRESFGSGWADPVVGKLRGVGNDYRRVKAIWNILSERGRKVAIIGWRDSWPAEVVDGYYVSDRIGWRPASPAAREKEPLSHLTYPDSLEQSLRPLLSKLPEADARADRTVLSVAPCEIDAARGRVARLGYSGDWLRHQAALWTLEHDSSIRFLAVYYSGVDVLGHLFMGGPRVGDLKCGIGPELVDRYYVLLDGYLGDWLERLRPEDTLIVVSDHGMKKGPIVGEHSDEGLVLMIGGRVPRGAAIDGAGVLDVAPTVLSLFDLPLARDMKGKPLPGVSPQAGSPPPVASYEKGARPLHVEQPAPEDEEELKERLKALGYIN